MSRKIPLLDLTREMELIGGEVKEAIQEVLRSRAFILGPTVEAFEDEVAGYLGVKHAIGVNSGTDALVIGLRALGVGAGDEVITTPFTYLATAEAVSSVGARPLFVDIDRDTFTIDPGRIEAAITPRTKAVIPVHLFGQAAHLEPIQALAQKHGFALIEDTAQAFGGEYRGKKLGTFGEVGAFSFFPTKNLGAYGDGGLVVTDNDEIARVCRMLRVHGTRSKYEAELIGYNSRLDALQAAILRVKLPHLDAWNSRRRQVALRYNELLGDVPGIETPREAPWCRHVYHQYTIRLRRDRDAVQERLAHAGVSSMAYYRLPLHQLPVYAGPGSALPVAQEAAAEVLSLPMWPHLPQELQEQVVEALRDAVRQSSDVQESV